MRSDPPGAAPAIVILMGVAGSGKTTIGEKLAAALGWPFRDADEFHSAANIAKMTAGLPLNDADRTPWLASIRAYLEETLAQRRCAVITCSALRERYRQALAGGLTGVAFVHLVGSYDLIRRRLGERAGHFMKADLLESQFATLEAPQNALTIDVAQSPEVIVAEIRTSLHL